MRKFHLKACALFLTLCLLIGLLPLSALAAETEATSQIIGQQLCLGDDLTMQFYARIAPEDVENGVLHVTVGEYTGTHPIRSLQAREDGTYLFSVSLGAPQMTDDITLTLVNGDATVLEKTYSVQAYAHYLLKGKYTTETKTLVKRLLNYGAAAQLYFGYNTQDLANAGYVLEPGTLTLEAPKVEVTGSVEGVRYAGSSLLFQSKLAVRHYFTADSIQGLTFTVNGKSCTPQAKGDMYYIDVTGINPDKMREEMTVTVADDAGSLSFLYNPMSYIARMYNKDTSAQALKDLLAAATGYFEAAEQYDGLTDGDVSLEANSTHVYPLNETPYLHLEAKTALSVSQVRDGVYPRVGLRLTNEAGATLDFVLGYSNAQYFWPDGFYIVQTDAEGNETKPVWKDLAAGTLPTDDNVTLSVKKEFETISVSFGEQLGVQDTFAGFGANDAVTVALYSRYTDTQFTDYEVKPLAIADSRLTASNHTFVLNETPYENLTAHTELSVSQVMNEVYARTGLRLTNEAGQKLDFVLSYNNNTAFWADGFYIVTYQEDGTEVKQWVTTPSGLLTGDQNVSLDLKVKQGQVEFYVNGTKVQPAKALEHFNVTGGMTVALYSKHTDTDFTGYSATEVTPTASDVENSGYVNPIGETVSANLTAQTTVTVSEVKNGVSPRVGLRLTNENGKNLDYVLAYKNTQVLWADYLLIVTWDDAGKEVAEWITLDAGTLPEDDNVTLKIRKNRDTLQFYLNGTLVHTKGYADFGAQNTATASEYSRYTGSDFAQSSALEVAPEDSIVEVGSHGYVIDTTLSDNFSAQTKLTVSEVKNGVAARVGLRLYNEAGSTLDYVLAYKDSQVLWNDYLLIVTRDSSGKEVAEWITLDAGTLTNDDAQVLKVEKNSGKLYFYLNGTLVKEGSYAGFGITNRAYAALYSKHTATDFDSYCATVLHPEDSAAASAYHMYTLTAAPTAALDVQTELTVTEVQNGYYARTGLRLINENDQYLDFVLGYTNKQGFWADYLLIVTWDDAGKEKQEWITLDAGTLPTDDEVHLQAQLKDGLLYLYLNGAEVYSGSHANFATDVAATAGLYSKYATTDFYNYYVN